MNVLVIDYGMGNLASVRRAFEEVGGRVIVSDQPSTLKEVSHIVLPGVGSFADGMANLNRGGWVTALSTTTALALPEPLVKPLFAESRKTQETTMQSRSTKKSAVVVLGMPFWISTYLCSESALGCSFWPNMASRAGKPMVWGLFRGALSGWFLILRRPGFPMSAGTRYIRNVRTCFWMEFRMEPIFISFIAFGFFPTIGQR